MKHIKVLAWPVGILVLAAVGTLVYMLNYSEPRLAIGQANKTLFFADGGSTLSALLYVAYEKTYFFTQKVNFHMSFYPSGKDALKALLEGKADLATVSDVPIAHAALDGNDFLILASIANSRQGIGILARDGIKNPDDLRGRKIGYSPGTNSEYFLHEFLVKYGISNSDVVLVPILPDQIEGALGKHGLDAVSAFDPTLANLRQVLGSKAQVFYAPDLYSFTWNVVISRRMLDYPEVLKNIVRALHVAEEYVKENPNEAIQISSRYLRMSELQCKTLWGSLNLNVDLTQGLLVNLERQAQWARPAHKNAELPDFGKYIYLDAMKAIIPSKVTVIE